MSRAFYKNKQKNAPSIHTLPFLITFPLLLSWVIPNHYSPWTSFYNEFSAWLILAVLLFYAALAPVPKKIPKWTLYTATLSLVPCLQIFNRHIFFTGDGLIASLYLAGLSTIYACSFMLGQDSRLPAFKLLAWTFLLGASFSACIAFYQWLGIQGAGIWIMDVRNSSRVYANLAQANNLATLLCLGIAAVVYLYSKKQISGVGTSFILVLLIFGVAMTQSRTPWLNTIFLLLWWALKRRSLPRLHGTALIGSCLFYIVLLISWPLIMEALYLYGGTRENMAAVGVRQVIWTQLLDAALRSPLWGYGWNQVSVAQVSVAAEYPPSTLVEHSHNILIDLLIWNGLPIGLVIIAGITLWLVTRALRCKTVESWFGLLAIGFIGIHGLLEFPLEYAYFLLPVGLLVGLVDADQRIKATVRVPRSALWGLLIASVAILALVWQEYRIIEEDHRLMRFETARIGNVRATQPAPDVVLLTQLREFIRFARTPAQSGMSAEELEWMQRVAHRYPYPPSLFRYAFALGINDRGSEALQQMQVLRQLHGEIHYAEANAALCEASRNYPALRQQLATEAACNPQLDLGERLEELEVQ